MTILKDVFLYIDGYDFQPVTSSAPLSSEKEAVDATTFGSDGARRYEKGLEQTTLEVQGNWGASSTGVDAELWADLAGDDERVYTLGEAPVETAIAWSFRANRTNYLPFADSIGSLAKFIANAEGRSRLLRGQLAAVKQTVTGLGPLGSVLNIGAVSATQHVYAVLHLFGTAGSSITVQVQSDDSSGMASPVTRGTIGPSTTAGAKALTPVAGTITDTHWRLNVSAIVGTWQVAGFIAIG